MAESVALQSPASCVVGSSEVLQKPPQECVKARVWEGETELWLFNIQHTISYLLFAELEVKICKLRERMLRATCAPLPGGYQARVPPMEVPW